VKTLPKFWLAYQSDPSDSGKIHSDVSLRWKNSDADVISAMKMFAQYTDLARLLSELWK
jgi:glucuronokinase